MAACRAHYPEHCEEQRHDSKPQRRCPEQIIGKLTQAAAPTLEIRRCRYLRRPYEMLIGHQGWGAPAVSASVSRSAWVALSVRKTAARFAERTKVGTVPHPH